MNDQHYAADELKAELELAVAELAFWLDFARWWQIRHCDEEEPRIGEILQHAEQRYANALDDMLNTPELAVNTVI